MVVPVEATRRLRFTSGTSKLTPDIQECSPDHLYTELDSTSPLDIRSDQSDKCKTVETVLRTSRKLERMELCTPLVRRVPSHPQVLCTPAVRTRTSDEMELCTPSVSNMELNSFVIEQIANPCDSNLEEKDSGISSPDCSLEESDNQELFWFVTPTPIRGFK